MATISDYDLGVGASPGPRGVWRRWADRWWAWMARRCWEAAGARAEVMAEAHAYEVAKLKLELVRVKAERDSSKLEAEAVSAMYVRLLATVRAETAAQNALTDRFNGDE